MVHLKVIFLKRFQCVGQPYEITKLHYCHLETYRNGTQVAGVVVEILKNLQKVYVTGGLYTQYFRTRTQLLATSIEYCQQGNNNQLLMGNAAAKFTLDYAQQHLPQLLTDCPVQVGHLFNITGVRISDSMIPVFVIPGTYYVELRIYSKRNQTVFLKRFQCVGQPYEISKLHYCQMETFRNGTQVAGVVVEILNNLHKIFVTGGLYTQYFRSRTQLLATSIEYCQQGNNNQLLMKNAVAKFALEYAQQHFPQLLTDCPLKVGQVFNITGVRIDDSLIPAFVIPGTYYVELRIYNKRNQTPLLIKRLDCTDEQSKASMLIQCTVHTCRNEPQTVNVLLDILEPTSKVVVALNLYTQYYKSKNLLYGTSFEYCELTKNANIQINPVTRIALNIAQENFPQVLKQCPLSGLINVTGLVMNSKLVPPYAPQGSYYFNIRAANKRNQTIISCTSEFQILQKPLLTRTLSMLG
uniref:Uncharacterized protein n=1 Tax=Anopheles minimus TaxID=112268 RepID=A0A182VYC5_9DIPT